MSQPLKKRPAVCLYCDEICNICTTVCPNFANYSYEISPVRFNLKKARVNDIGNMEIQTDKVFEVNQRYQIITLPISAMSAATVTTFVPQAVLHLRKT